MESFIDESHNQIKDFFLDLQSRFKEAAELCCRQYEKKIKQQDDEMRHLKEKLTKKDEILKFHEDEINALRKQVQSLKTERPICPSCSQREDHLKPTPNRNKRIFSPDSSCAQSTEGNCIANNNKDKPQQEKFQGKRRRTDPLNLEIVDRLAATVTPENSDPMEKAFVLDKTPERTRKHFQTNDFDDFKLPKKDTRNIDVKSEVQENNVPFHINDLSPASMKSLDLGKAVQDLGPEVGDSLLHSQRDSVIEESPPLIPVRGAAKASVPRRHNADRLGTRSSRNTRQMKLHTLTFATKRDLSVLMHQKAKKSVPNFQDLDETVLESQRETRQTIKSKISTNENDLPLVGSSPSEVKLFKKPKIPKPVTQTFSELASTAGESSNVSSPEKLRAEIRDSGTEFDPLDPIACSTLKVSDSNFTEVTSLIDHTESVVFGTTVNERKPLSPKNNEVENTMNRENEKDKKEKNDPKRNQFKFVGAVERRKNERRNLEGFSCYECYEYYRGSNLTGEEIHEKIRQCSRHRAKHVPPSTPEGFWDVDLPSTPVNDSPIDFQRKRRRKPYQFPKNN